MDGHQGFKKILEEKKSFILEAWFQTMVKTYPTEVQGFLQKKEDTFTNPIGSTIYDSLAAILEEIIQDKNLHRTKKSIEEIIHLRAVQNFSPSQAISFLPTLKQIIRKELSATNLVGDYQKEYDNFSLFIDELTMQAFDIYMGCREKIFKLKVKEIQRKIRSSPL